MNKKSKYPVYLVGHKNGMVMKCKSAGEIKTYRDTNGGFYFELDHYPSKEEVQQLLDSLKKDKDKETK